MSKLLDYYADLEDEDPDEPLRLVNRQHPVNVRKKRYGVRSETQVELPLSNLSISSPFLDLPVDIVNCIFRFLHLKDLWMLSISCKSLCRDLHLQNLILQQAFSQENIPRGTYKQYVKQHKTLYDNLLSLLDGPLGQSVNKFVVHEFMSISELQLVARSCPNLRYVDFAGVMEPVDFTRYKSYLSGCRHGSDGNPVEDIPKAEQRPFVDIYDSDQFTTETNDKLHDFLREMSRCYACRDRFQWPLVLKSCPDLFANLTSVKVMYEGHTLHQARGSIPGRKHFPYFLKSMPRLQTLTLECWRDVDEKHPDKVMSWYECHPQECKRFQEALVNNVSRELRILELNGIIELTPDFGKFTRLLERLPKLRTIKVALQHDLKRKAATTWLHKAKRHSSVQHYLNNPMFDKDVETPPDLLLEYIRSLRSAISRGWTIKSLPNSAGYELSKPWRYFDLLEPQNIEHLRWLLRSDLQWNPIWKWKSYMYRDGIREGWRPQRYDPDVVKHAPRLRQLFTVIRDSGKPVRLQLATPGSEDSFFAWQQATGDKIIGAGSYDVFPWRVDLVGDLVDEVNLLWRDREDHWAFGAARFDEAPPDRVTPEVAASYVRMQLDRLKGTVEQRLFFEAEHMAPFFQQFRVWFPNLKRLVLFIPSTLYPDSDREFIERVLPGQGGWTVRHCNARPNMVGYTKDLVTQEETMHWPVCDDEETNDRRERRMNHERKISVGQIDEMLRKMEHERCPNIERVFERRLDHDGVPLKGLPSIDEEWHRTKRSGMIKNFDPTTLVSKRRFEYLWPGPL